MSPHVRDDQMLEQRLREHFGQVGLSVAPTPVPTLAAVEGAARTLGRLGVLAKVAAAVAAIVAGLGGLTLTVVLGGWWQADEEPQRVVVSPWLSTVPPLNDDPVLFEVITGEPQPWRLVALDTFEDDIWKLAGTSIPVADVASTPLGEPVSNNEFTIFDGAALGIWVPSPAAIVSVEDPRLGLQWLDGLVVDNDIPHPVEGDHYAVTSLAAGSAPSDRDKGTLEADVERHLALDLSAQELAALEPLVRSAVVPDASTRAQVERLIDQLESLRRSPDGSESGSGTVLALFESGEGQEAQFVSALAVMSRMMGIPSRVVVGFDPGDVVMIDDEGRSHVEVRSGHKRTWVEIHDPDEGWIRFDPAPPAKPDPDPELSALLPAEEELGELSAIASVRSTTAHEVFAPLTPDTAACGMEEPLRALDGVRAEYGHGENGNEVNVFVGRGEPAKLQAFFDEVVGLVPCRSGQAVDPVDPPSIDGAVQVTAFEGADDRGRAAAMIVINRGDLVYLVEARVADGSPVDVAALVRERFAE